MKKEANKSKNVGTIAFLTTALAGRVLWAKRGLLKGIVRLKCQKKKFVKIKEKPATFLTKADENSKEELFCYLTENSAWRLVDHIANGYFWLNEREEVLLLTQNTVMMKKYWSWQASRSFEDKL